MPTISSDRKSFLIDGHRVWIVSGSIPYARVPRGLWRARIQAAKQAGLNCIETFVFWNAHEKRAGKFDWAGDLDVRAFVQMVGEEGMFCILRPGPYIGSDWDNGGLPPFLHTAAEEVKKNPQPLKVRQSDPVFLKATARYFKALMEQVGDLQITRPPAGLKPKAPRGNPAGDAAGGYRKDAGGPIILVQAEHEWFCNNPDEQVAYLERLVSMLRQNGCEVPIYNCNNLWQPVEGTFDTWNGAKDLPAMMRQLATIHPDVPPMVSEYWTGGSEPWGQERTAKVDGPTHAYRMAGLLGVGAQFNLHPFHGGTNFGFTAGRSPSTKACYLTTSSDDDAPLGEAGGRGPKYRATKRLCTFASQFGHVLAQRGKDQTTCIALNETDHPVAVLQQSGSQGTAVFLLKSKKDRTAHAEVLLPNGLKLPVPLAGQRVAWLLLDTTLGGVANLDYTNLSPWAFIDRQLLVVFGPPGSEGIISIDGQQQMVTVPTGKQPLVIEGNPLRVLVMSREQVDAAYISKDGVVIGADGLDEAGNPLPLTGWATQTTVSPEGQVSSKRVRQLKTGQPPRLRSWQTLTLKPIIDGDDAAYDAIDGPLALDRLEQPQGYGWYRVALGQSVSGKMMVPVGGDRLHFYQGGKLAGLLGTGEGASDGPTPMKLGGDVVVLADHLGRYSYGQHVGQDVKGFDSHLYTVKPIALGKPKIIKQPAGDPFAVTGMVYHRRSGDQPMAEALEWEIKPASRKPVVFEIEGLPQAAVLTINGQPTHYYGGKTSGHFLRVVLDPTDKDGPFTGGKNQVKLALLKPLQDDADPAQQVRAYQTQKQVTTAGKGWAFAKWTVPSGDDDGWRPLPKTLPSQSAWFCSRFLVGDTSVPLWLEPRGMTKGQIILNGHNLGRYWMQTREGKQVGPQQRYYLPEPWLKTEGDNELLLFDEHGRAPTSAKLVYATSAYHA